MRCKKGKVRAGDLHIFHPLRTGHHHKHKALPNARIQSSPMTTNDNGKQSPSRELREETLKATAPSSRSPYRECIKFYVIKKLQASNHILSFGTPERKQNERRGNLLTQWGGLAWKCLLCVAVMGTTALYIWYASLTKKNSYLVANLSLWRPGQRLKRTNNHLRPNDFKLHKRNLS